MYIIMQAENASVGEYTFQLGKWSLAGHEES